MRVFLSHENRTMKIAEIINHLESVAPPSLQESYDNAGLIVGKASAEATGAVLCLDSTEAVIDEAIDLGYNMVIAHHPIVFKGLKRFNGRNYVERVVMKAIKNDIAIYAIHTNLDNVYHQGVNAKIAEKIGLVDTQILAPKQTHKKLFVFVPPTHSDTLRNALFEVGAGQINENQHLSYATVGAGSQNGEGAAQVKLEVLFPAYLQGKIVTTIETVHPFANPSFDIINIENSNTLVGSGMVGNLEKAMPEKAFLKHLKQSMGVGCIKYTTPLDNKVKRVAVCGGSGGFLLRQAIAQKADVFITADYKYHEFFDADGRIMIADIGHYESEQYTIDLLNEIITKKFRNFATHCTKVNTNPVNYL